MPRSVTGTYTLTAGNPVITGTLIESTWANTTLTDVANEMTDSLSRSGKGGMTAPLRTINGTALIPSHSFTNFPTSGLYMAGAGDVRMATTGIDRMRWRAATNTTQVWDSVNSEWVTVGDVLKVGTPVDNQLGVWTGARTIEGDANLTFDGTTLAVSTVDAVNFTDINSQGTIQAPASTTTLVPVNIPAGDIVAAPVDGDVWSTINGFFGRVNGVTQPFGVGTYGVGQTTRSGTLNQVAVLQDPETTTQGFSAAIYTGNSGVQSINTGLDMDTGDLGGLVWIKSRSDPAGQYVGIHNLFDTIRSPLNALSSDTTDAEIVRASSLTGFTNTGFDLGSFPATNYTTHEFAAWSWQTTKKTSGFTNENKDYTTHYNPDTGFSIVAFAGSSTKGHGIPHHLGVAPELSIIKSRDSSFSWSVTGKDIGDHEVGSYVKLDSIDAVTINNAFGNIPTVDSLVLLGSGNNLAGLTYISYHWASVEGFSKIGRYTGTGAAGNYVECGFKPAYVMLKPLTATGGWFLGDNQRGDNYLTADSADQEFVLDVIDMGESGFVLKSGAWNEVNNEFLFMAFADDSQGGAGLNTYSNSDYTYPTDANDLTIAQNTLISFASGFNANGQVDTTESVGGGVTVTLGAGFEDKHLYIYKNLAGVYSTTENRPLFGLTRNTADFWGVETPSDPSLRTTDKHFGYESPTGTVSASSDQTSFESWRAFDKGYSTPNKWVSATVACDITYKFSEPRVPMSYRLRNIEVLGYFPQSLEYRVSHDGITWNVVDVIVGLPQPNINEWSDLRFPIAAPAYQYHQLNITNTYGAACQVADIEFNTILLSDYYLVNEGVMYSGATDLPIQRTYLAEFRTDSNGGVINETIVNIPPALQRFDTADIFNDLTVHGEIENRGVCTAWVNFDGTTNPPLIRDSYNVADVVATAAGVYKIIFEEAMVSPAYTFSAGCNQFGWYINEQTSQYLQVVTTNSAEASAAAPIVAVQFFGGKDIK